MTPMTPTEHVAFKARLLRAMMRHKAECGLGSDEQVMIAYGALLKVPSIRHRQWLREALSGDERPLDG